MLSGSVWLSVLETVCCSVLQCVATKIVLSWGHCSVRCSVCCSVCAYESEVANMGSTTFMCVAVYVAVCAYESGVLAWAQQRSCVL